MIIFIRSRGEVLPTWLLALCFLLSHQRTYGLDEDIKRELETPNADLSYKTMNYFINLVNSKWTDFKMIEISRGNTFENYKECNTSYDVQILQSNEMGQDVGLNYITIKSMKDKTTGDRYVYVYDSLLRKEMSEKHRQIIDKRYERHPFLMPQHPKTWQISGPSSGPLAIAYATLLLMKQDPRTYRLRMDMSQLDPTMELRKHILRMFRKNELSLFPEANSKDQFSPQIMEELGSVEKPFSDATINYFIQMVRLYSKFDMINLKNYDKTYQRVKGKGAEADVQILYGNGRSSDGYYICVYYDPNKKKVIVYDILMNTLSSRNKKIIKERYPEHTEIVYARPSEEQKERTEEREKNFAEEHKFGKIQLALRNRTADKEKTKISSGPLSIAYAATLIYHATPKDIRTRQTYTYEIDQLRLLEIKTEETIFEDSHPDSLRRKILHLFRENALFSYTDGITSGYIKEKPVRGTTPPRSRKLKGKGFWEW